METDSVEDLEKRQRISTMIGFGQWEKAEREIERLRKHLDADYPRVRQELLLWDALFQWKKENDLEGSLKMLLEALYCTMPEAEEKYTEWWVFQREEVVIVNNIVSISRKLGHLKKARIWAEAVRHSLEKQCEKTGIALTGYDILMGSYDNVLADSGYIKEALEVDKEAVKMYLRSTRIRCLASVYYRIAWNSYEVSSKDAELQEVNRFLWQDAYRTSVVLAEYIYDYRFMTFLKEDSQKVKYLY